MSYWTSGLLCIIYFLIPAEVMVAKVILFGIIQAVMNSCFYMVNAYSMDIFSTDIRQFSFNILDSGSKVRAVFISSIIYASSKLF